MEPGQSILLRDVLTQREVRVREFSASREVTRFALVLTRVVEPGASGQPEMESAVLVIPRRRRESLLSTLTRSQEAGTVDRDLGPICHQAWLSAFTTPLPEMANTDGDPLEPQKLVFRVLDRPLLIAALGEWEGLVAAPESDPRSWSWVVDGPRGQSISVAHLELSGDRLFVHVNSGARAERVKARLEAVATSSIAYRMTVHEDLQQMMKAGPGGASASPKADLPLELVEELTLDHYRKHLWGNPIRPFLPTSSLGACSLTR